MPRYRYKGRVPRPVKCADGEVKSITPGTEFEASEAAVAALKKQSLVVKLPDLKVVDGGKAETKDAKPEPPKDKPKADDKNAADKKVDVKSDKKADEKAEEKKSDEEKSDSKGFKRAGK